MLKNMYLSIAQSVAQRLGCSDMARLIDADRLLGFIDFDKAVIGEEHEASDIIAMIKTAPTVEAVPVRHGKWIVTAGGKQCDCPVCGEWFDNTCNYDIRKTWKFCPVCCTRLEADGD